MSKAKVPASIRYKNPGAMWGSALAIKWGAQKNAVALNDGKGQGNNIAVFQTYVDGICAQLDLWRTSKHYKNKKFADAIRIWSGGNSVESYIKFVLKRVPGMTRNTVMNDAFWRSEMGIAFLKAQAWHEAGKKYPAPNADWIEAQRRVFADAAVPAEPPVEEIQGDPEIWHIQRRLKAMNYNPGGLDGLWGGNTAGAIAGFVNDRAPGFTAPTSDELFRKVLPQLKAELAEAEAEEFMRPVSVERAEITADELAKKLPEVKAAQDASFWSKVQGWFSATFSGVTATGVAANMLSAKEAVDPFESWVSAYWPHAAGGAVIIIVIVIAIVLAKKATNAANASADATVTAFQEGTRA